MKRVYTILIILLAAGLLVNAQTRRTPGERARVLQKVLNLSEGQEGSIEFIFIQTDEKIDKILKENSGDREKAGKLIKQTIEESDKQVMRILNPKQKEKYAQIKEEQREQRDKKMHSSGAAK